MATLPSPQCPHCGVIIAFDFAQTSATCAQCGKSVRRSDLAEVQALETSAETVRAPKHVFPQKKTNPSRLVIPDENASTEAVDLQNVSGASDPTQIMPPQASSTAGSPASTTVFTAPRFLGPYELLQPVGRGGMGVVYEAIDTRLRRKVALKVIRAGQDADSEEVKRFRMESEHAAKLKHPNIIPIYDVGREGELDYFTMRFVEGETLDDWLKRRERPFRIRAEVMAKTVNAIEHAHQQGVIHRDIKPGNILIDRAGEPNVMDFGLARSVEVDSGMTVSGVALGTPAYMSPEQAQARREDVGPRSDVWGLGAVLYECLVGRPPFSGENVFQIMSAVVAEDPMPPRKIDPKVPRDLETICLMCLAKNPRRRYESAGALAQDLESWLAGEPIWARPAALHERIWQFCRRRPVFAVSAVLLAALVFSAFWLLQTRNELEVAKTRALLAEKESAEKDKETQRKREREQRQRAEEAIRKGREALTKAREQLLRGNRGEYEEGLINAEGYLRKAMFEIPDHPVARELTREAAREHFKSALETHDWRLAREKIKLAEDGGEDVGEIEKMETRLETARNARSRKLQARVRELMDDAAKTIDRTTPHDKAEPELISLRDPVTVKVLSEYVPSTCMDQQLLAIKALMWLGDVSVATALLPYIWQKRPDEKANDIIVQAAAFNAICNLAPEDMKIYEELRSRLASEAYLSGRLAENTRYYRLPYFDKMEKAIELQQQSFAAEDWFEIGKRRAESGNFTGAIEAFNKAIEKNDQVAVFYNFRGCAYGSIDKLDEALSNFDRALQLDNNVDFLLNRAIALYRLKKFEETLKDCDEIISKKTNLFGAYHLRAITLSRQGKLVEAERDCSLIIEKIKSDDDEVYSNRGQIRHGLKRLDEAEKDFNFAIKLVPNKSQNFYFRGLVYQEKGEWEKALEDFTRAISLDPKDADAYESRGYLRLLLGDFHEAAADMEKAKKLRPKSATIFEKLAAIYCFLEENEKANENLRALCAVDQLTEEEGNRRLQRINEDADNWQGRLWEHAEPKTTNQRLNRGGYFFEQGRHLDAIRDMELVVKEKESAKAYFILARCRESTGDLDKAHESYRATVLLAKGASDEGVVLNTAAWFFLTWSKRTKEDAETALEWATRAVELAQRKDPKILDTLALALFRNEKIEEAIETQKEAIALLPANQRGGFERRLKEYEAALKK
jgi:serine/threonine protein kinase/Flp pilus assembly protein TadD